jgi:transporter family-2 protein
MAPRRRALSSQRRTTLALACAVAAGVAISLQVFVNGRLSGSLGSPVLAGTVNNLSGLLFLVILGSSTGVPRRAKARFAARSGLRWWHVAAGVNGALFITVGAYSVPRLGVALFTVAVVCGQLAGSLVVDRRGLSPGAMRPFTGFRILAVALALTATALGLVGGGGDVQPELVLLALVAGAGVAVQQAAMGHIALATGEPVAAAALNFTVGASVLVAVAILSAQGPDTWTPSLVECVGGAIGATCAAVMATIVGRLGVLRLMLALVAGQSIGALVLDLVAPPTGGSPTALTFFSAALAVLAVLVSGLNPRRGDLTPIPESQPFVEARSTNFSRHG